MEALSRRVLEGRLENLPPEKKTDVAVFLSSTFTGACLYACIMIIIYSSIFHIQKLYWLGNLILVIFVFYRVLHAM